MPYLVHRLHLCYFTGGGIELRRARSCWVRPWLSAERRLQYGHYDRLLAELRIEAFFNFNTTGNVVHPSFSYCNFKLFRNLSDS